MAESPDREIRFRHNDKEGARGDGDNQFEDADDTLPDHLHTERHSLGGGDVPQRICRERDHSYGGYDDGANYRMSMKPEPYDGSEDWEEYISHFEICAELGRWRENDKVLTLAAALRGPARTFYISLTTLEKRDYAVLIQRLGQRFGSTRQQNRWLSRLEMRKRKPGESIAALADDLRQMAQRAYTDLDARAQEVLALNQLYKSVPAEVKYQCTNQDCKSVTDAVEIVERYEAILGDGTEKKKSAVRMTTENSQNDKADVKNKAENGILQDNLQDLTRRIAELENQKKFHSSKQTDVRVGSRPNYRQTIAKPGRRDVRCFLCEEPGHVCKNCPIFNRCKEELKKEGTRQSATSRGSQNSASPLNGRNQGNFRNPLAH